MIDKVSTSSVFKESKDPLYYKLSPVLEDYIEKNKIPDYNKTLLILF